MMAVAIVVVAILALYYTFVPTNCQDYSCYEVHMAKCASATFVNEESDASWYYTIKGSERESCAVEVTLLSAKDSDLGLRNYEGTSMRCYYGLGVAGYPEKNLAACHGELKEGLQSIVIEKLYKYVVSNLGEIREDLLV